MSRRTVTHIGQRCHEIISRIDDKATPCNPKITYALVFSEIENNVIQFVLFGRQTNLSVTKSVLANMALQLRQKILWSLDLLQVTLKQMEGFRHLSNGLYCS